MFKDSDNETNSNLSISDSTGAKKINFYHHIKMDKQFSVFASAYNSTDFEPSCQVVANTMKE